MSSSAILPSYFSTKMLLKGSLLGSLLLLSIGPMFAVTVPLAVQAQSVSLMAQVLRNESPPGCTASGCQLNIERSLLRRGDRVTIRHDGEERQILRKGDRRKLQFALTAPVRNRTGQIVVPQNSVVEGR
uniref:hypothetical protein n=1 Tax=Trichocoleus desertorum TaxID=1481672 RepID=UPI0025B2E48B|nr:hypothetical protein [Trichocoleus desertorum]